MASSGSFNTSAFNATDGTRYLVFSWTVASQDIANNQTKINWTLKGGGTSTQDIYAGNFKVVIAGETVYNYTGARFPIANGTSIASGTYTFTHNDDGTKQFTASAEGGVYTYAVNCTGSKTFTLDTIARASQPSCITWPEHTQNVGNFGDEISIHMNRKANAFTHTVRYQFGSASGTIATKVGTGTTWKIPLALMDLIPNALKGSGTIYVDTYNGSTKIGTKSCGFTATVPASVKPTCTMTLEDITEAGDIYGSPVQNLSKIKVTINPTIAYSSPIVAYSITANGATYAKQTATTDVLTAAGDSVVKVTVEDKRGRTGSASYTMKVQAYTYPRVNGLTVHRCDENGTENEQGDYISAVFSAAISGMGGKNTAAYALKYKTSSATNYSTVNLDDLAGAFTVDNYEYIFEADSNASYDLEVIATDRHGTASRQTSASTAFTLMNWGADGTSMAIGKVAEKPNTLQVALDAEFLGKVKGTIFDAIYPVNSIYLSYSHVNPSTLFGGTWVRIESAFLWATGATGTIGVTGGEREHTLTASELPKLTGSARFRDIDLTDSNPILDASGIISKSMDDWSGTHGAFATENKTSAYKRNILNINIGGDQAHNNMPPYIQVSVWRRTA